MKVYLTLALVLFCKATSSKLRGNYGKGPIVNPIDQNFWASAPTQNINSLDQNGGGIIVNPTQSLTNLNGLDNTSAAPLIPNQYSGLANPINPLYQDQNLAYGNVNYPNNFLYNNPNLAGDGYNSGNTY